MRINNSFNPAAARFADRDCPQCEGFGYVPRHPYGSPTFRDGLGPLVWCACAQAAHEQANARLRASAPDLLAALERSVEIFTAIRNANVDGLQTIQDTLYGPGNILSMIRAAIAKARE